MASKAMKGKSAETLTWNTPEGFPVKPLYTIKDREYLPKDNEVISTFFINVFINLFVLVTR